MIGGSRFNFAEPANLVLSLVTGVDHTHGSVCASPIHLRVHTLVYSPVAHRCVGVPETQHFRQPFGSVSWIRLIICAKGPGSLKAVLWLCWNSQRAAVACQGRAVDRARQHRIWFGQSLKLGIW